MANYEIIFENVSDPNTPIGQQFIEYVTADSVAQAEAMLRRDAGRYVDVALYTWTIREIPS